jgi:sugar lactone lactonase YvrE
MLIRFLTLLALAVAVAAAIITSPATASRSSGHHVDVDLPDRLDLPDGWQPEGITSGRRFDLYVGSIPTGAILRLNARTGASRTVVEGRADRAAIGIKLDRRRRLFVAGGGTGQAFVYDARTGADLAELRLTNEAATFVNDVALTRRAAYFTDSRRSVIYAVGTDLGAPRTIPVPGIPTEAGINLNGIVATPAEDALLAVQTNAGRLWRIDPATGASVQVDLGGRTLENGDGLFLKGRTLYVVQNRSNKIAVVRLNAGYTAGTVVTEISSTRFDVPTTITFLKGQLYAVNARFGTPTPDTADYWVTLVRR